MAHCAIAIRCSPPTRQRSRMLAVTSAMMIRSVIVVDEVDSGATDVGAGAAPAPTSVAPESTSSTTITDLIIIADVTASMRDRCRVGGEQRMAIAQWAI